MGPTISSRVLPFLRALFLIFSAAGYTAVLCLPVFFACLLDRSGRWPSLFQKLWVKWLLKTNGIRVNQRGADRLDPGESFILVSNHASILDIPGIIFASPFPVRFLAKKSLAWFPVFGWLLVLSGHILIDRESAPSALKSLKKASALLKKGISIIVFPEGTRSADGGVKDFKRGAFLLARHSGFPLVPVSIRGTYRMLPRQGWLFRPGTMEVRMGEPVAARGLPRSGAGRLMLEVREAIIRNLGPQEPSPPPHEGTENAAASAQAARHGG